MSLICDAIRTHSLLEFDYHGLHRVVAPYCHGVSTGGVEVLRGVQVGGRSGSGGHGFGFGKLWVVADLVGLELTGERFEPDDPHYNPDDRAMERIHCRVDRAAAAAHGRRPAAAASGSGKRLAASGSGKR